MFLQQPASANPSSILRWLKRITCRYSRPGLPARNHSVVLLIFQSCSAATIEEEEICEGVHAMEPKSKLQYCGPAGCSERTNESGNH